MSNNQEKLNEQLINVILSENSSDEVKLKRVKYLVRLGADVNKKVNGKSLLRIAREKGDKEIENVIKESLRKSFEKLLEGDKFDRVLDECGFAHGHKVVVSKEKAIDLGNQFWDYDGKLKSAKEIEDLIQQGADVNIQNNYGRTALLIASRCGREDVVRILLENGADVNHKDNFGNTAMMEATDKKTIKVIKEYIKKTGGEPTNDGFWGKNFDGLTMQKVEKMSGNQKKLSKKKLNEQLVKVVLDTKTCDEVRIKRAEYLISLGADVNQKVNGKSLLKIAREKGYKEIENVIKESLVKSFEEALDSDKFERVLDECEYVNGHEVIVSKQKSIDLGNQFWDDEGKLKSAKEIEDLIQQGADVDVKVNYGLTALLNASYWGREDVVGILLENGADVHHKDNCGETALMRASYCGHKGVVKLLLENGADVNEKDNYGETALMMASKSKHLDVVRILLEAGADVHQKDIYDKTALMRATDKETKKVIKEHIKKTGGEPTNGGFLGKIIGGLTR